MPRLKLRCVRCGTIILTGDERFLVQTLCVRCMAREVRRLGDIPNSTDDVERPPEGPP